jgi:phospholipid/cholesterol/gamma-HCH transport system substrate-binding protein
VVYLGFVAIRWVQADLLGNIGYILHADFATASGLHVGDPVEIAGVNVGEVESMRLADYKARVAFRIRDKVRIYDDAIVSIKTEGFIGDRTVSIDPGTSGKALLPGEEIKETDSPRSLQYLLGKLLAGDVISGE